MKAFSSNMIITNLSGKPISKQQCSITKAYPDFSKSSDIKKPL